MKWVSSIALAAAFCSQMTPASAQLPPDLLGSSGPATNGELRSEQFYKAKDGMWVLMHPPEDNGYKCSINFFSGKDVMAIYGPWNEDMKKKGAGMVWLNGERIPEGSAKPKPIKLDIESVDGPQKNVPALLGSIGKDQNIIILIVNIKELLKAKEDANIMKASIDGQMVFDVSLVQLKKAYGKLNSCMEKRS